MAWRDIPKKDNPGHKERQALRRAAAKCPKCDRGNAVTKLVTDELGKPLGFACRYCGYIRAIKKTL